MDLLLASLGWILETLRHVLDVCAYAVCALWTTIVRGSIGLLEALDDWLPDFGVLDNPLLRLLVMGVAGFFVGVVLMIFLCIVTGNWEIVSAFVLVVVFFMFVGLVADPDKEWRVGSFADFIGGRGPGTPLNL